MKTCKLSKLSAALLVGAMALAGAGVASAQTVVGGGATLPEPFYDEVTPSGLGKTDFTYTGTGSGGGKANFFNNNPRFNAGNDTTWFRNESLAPVPADGNRPPAWPTTQTVHFAGSDSIVTTAEHANYLLTNNTAWGPYIQVPAVGTAVLLPYVLSGTTNLNLSTAQVCQIFSNIGISWGQVLNGTPDGRIIRVVYRTDGSGTTELLSNYLKAACPSSNFTVSNNFQTVVQNVVGTIPSNAVGPWYGVSGSPAVGNVFKNLDPTFGAPANVIGYLSPEPSYTGSSNAVVARINGTLPTAAGIRDALVASAPSLPAVTTGSPSGLASNPLSWVPNYVLPDSGYPIYGTTNLLVNQCYVDAGAQQKVLTFLTDLYNGNLDNAIETGGAFTRNLVPVLNGTSAGHLFAKLPPAWISAIQNNFVTNASTNGLNIGNATACSGKGRP